MTVGRCGCANAGLGWSLLFIVEERFSTLAVDFGALHGEEPDPVEDTEGSFQP